jgi:alanine-alpha-ketoisovalerate/valine-pyruvate aminotransferase
LGSSLSPFNQGAVAREAIATAEEIVALHTTLRGTAVLQAAMEDAEMAAAAVAVIKLHFFYENQPFLSKKACWQS